MRMTDAERNVALETLRYCEQKQEAQQAEAASRPDQDAAVPQSTEPLTQCVSIVGVRQAKCDAYPQN